MPGQAKIHELRFVIRVEKNISGLDIAVQQVVFERHVQGGGDFDSNIQHLELGDALLFLDAGIEAAAVGQFHHQVTLAFEFVERINVDDVRMIQ